MTERQGGARRLDKRTEEWLKKASSNPGALTAKQRRERQRVRVMYDLPPEVKQAIERVAVEQKTSASQAAALLLTWALLQYVGRGMAAREIDDAFYEGHEPSRTPRFEWNVEIPEDWIAIIRERQH